MSFKLLAIRPLKGCNEKFRKVLHEGTIYKFYSDYKYLNTKGEEINSNNFDKVNSIIYNPTISEKFFTQNNTNINISAIVGKNGSGKSSIVELLYIALYNISCSIGTLPKQDEEKNIIKKERKIYVEIYYCIEGEYFKLLMNKFGTKLFRQSKFFPIFESDAISRFKEKRDLLYLFYSTVINYSHYAFNSTQIGDWVKHIFHKNDGYQTPIVLNPYRKEGIIDINREEYLTRSRLIASLLFYKKNGVEYVNFRTISPNKTATKLKFSFKPQKTDINKIDKKYRPFIKKNRSKILKIIFSIFETKLKIDSYSITEKMLSEGVNYLIVKILSISDKYEPYKLPKFSFWQRVKNEKSEKSSYVYQIDFVKFENFLKYLYEDKSHITFKIRQAINFLLNFDFYFKNENAFIGLDEIANVINTSKEKSIQQLMEIVPPPFFDFDIMFESGSVFSLLSSGEKQKIFSSASYAYHLVNLNSVEEDRTIDKYKYKNVNIIFDEIELYYHPELQRTFVFEFLDTINWLNLDNIDNINCVFVTHSPFILSDIPKQNVLFLNEKGESNNEFTSENTFGANVHDLLKNDFFLNEGFIGEFAKRKISDVINSLYYRILINKIERYKKERIDFKELEKEKSILEKGIILDKNTCVEIIQYIGEPVLKLSIIELVAEAFPDDEDGYIKTHIKNISEKLNAK